MSLRVDSSQAPFAWHDAGFVVPEVDRLVVYELHVGELTKLSGATRHCATSRPMTGMAARKA